jgi:hypothetical protein
VSAGAFDAMAAEALREAEEGKTIPLDEILDDRLHFSGADSAMCGGKRRTKPVPGSATGALAMKPGL